MFVLSESQKKFRQLEDLIRQNKPDDKHSELAGSFSAFQNWLKTYQPEVLLEAAVIAQDIRLWRDSQDVLRQLWEQVYGH